MKSIAILGSNTSSKNRGVQALASSLISLCLKHNAEMAITVMLGNPFPHQSIYRYGKSDILIKYVNYRLSPKSKLNQHIIYILTMCIIYNTIKYRRIRRMASNCTPWIRELEKVDVAVDIRGGDSFSDMYGLKRYIIGCMIAWSVILVKGSIIQMPQTFGPFNSKITRLMARFILNRSRIIMARDNRSHDIVSSMVNEDCLKNIYLVPDVAFTLESDKPDKIILDPPIANLEIGLIKNLIGININGLVFNGGYNKKNMFKLVMNYQKFFLLFLTELIHIYNKDILFVPHTYADKTNIECDTIASIRLRESLPSILRNRIKIVANEYEAIELKGIIGMCDFFIGSRMHSCIAALSQGVPCVGIAYSDKFHGIFETVDMGNWIIDARQINELMAVKRTIILYHQRNEVRECLRKNAVKAKFRVHKAFKNMFGQTDRVDKTDITQYFNIGNV